MSDRNTNMEEKGHESLELQCSFGIAGFGCEIDSLEEITLELLSEGIDECMCHEFCFEDESAQALKMCGYIKGVTDKCACPDSQRLTEALKEMLCPIGIDCTVNDEAFEIGEDIRAKLEEQYIEYAVNWILNWEV